MFISIYSYVRSVGPQTDQLPPRTTCHFLGLSVPTAELLLTTDRCWRLHSQYTIIILPEGYSCSSFLHKLHPHPKNLVYTRRHPCRKSVNIDIAHPAPAAARPVNATTETAKTIGNDRRRRRRRPRRSAGVRPPYPSHPSRRRKVTIALYRSTRRGRRPNSSRTRRSFGGTTGP